METQTLRLSTDYRDWINDVRRARFWLTHRAKRRYLLANPDDELWRTQALIHEQFLLFAWPKLLRGEAIARQRGMKLPWWSSRRFVRNVVECIEGEENGI